MARNYEQHGMKKHKLYSVWCNIKTRCFNNKVKHYKDYGGRGITMCSEWKDSFISFYEWVKENGYENGLQLDRIDNDGNYEPSNCQFISQSKNKAVGKKRKNKNNTSGFVGVSFRKDNNKWRTWIPVNAKRIYLGTFSTIEEALQSRIDAEIKYFNEQRTNLHYVKLNDDSPNSLTAL
jgi:hypothetical protein